VLAGRLRDLAAYVDRTPEPDWRYLRVELEAMAKTMYRLTSSSSSSSSSSEKGEAPDLAAQDGGSEGGRQAPPSGGGYGGPAAPPQARAREAGRPLSSAAGGVWGDGDPPRSEGERDPSAHGLQLVVHLGMTGQWRCVPADTPEPDHLHAVLDLDDGRQLRYRDARRFGRLLLGTEAELVAHRKIPRLGPEPLDPGFTSDDLYRRLHIRRAPLKALLLDQMVLAGVGNIYADESCFRARVRPDRPANTLSRRSVARLHESLAALLREAIANRGSSVDNYRDAWGEMGGEQEQLLVYGRAGEPCVRCGRPLALVRLAGRSTVFCRRCQR
jgi:formamidopyrimidine-DNA glycosylase